MGRRISCLETWKETSKPYFGRYWPSVWFHMLPQHWTLTDIWLMSTAFRLYLLLQVYDSFWRDKDLSNGLVTIQKLWWRCHSFHCQFTSIWSILGISTCTARSLAQGDDTRLSLVPGILLHSPKRCSDRGGLAATRGSLILISSAP